MLPTANTTKAPKRKTERKRKRKMSKERAAKKQKEKEREQLRSKRKKKREQGKKLKTLKRMESVPLCCPMLFNTKLSFKRKQK